MHERAQRNTFSRELIRDLEETIARVSERSDVHVIVITGYDNYFCCGGTQRELLSMCDGTLEFAQFDFFDLLLRCKLPVVAAMQGHAIGGGLAFGCFADVIVMAD